MKIIKLLLIVFSLASSVSFGAVKSTIPTVVHISFIDDMAFTLATMNETNRFLKLAIPDAKLISVHAHVPRFFANTDTLREKIDRQIRKRLKPTDLITHLLIDTHGSTVSSHNEPGEQVTRLGYVGEIGRTDADEDFREFVKPLKGRFADGAKIILNSCLTFCGTSEEVTDRAGQFLKELEITNGQIYGATVQEVDTPGALVSKNAFWKSARDLGQLKLLAATGFALGLPMGFAFSHGDVSAMLTPTILTASVFAAIAQLGLPILKTAIGTVSGYNLGRLFVFRNGKKISETAVHKYKDKLQIYAPSCAAAFTHF